MIRLLADENFNGRIVRGLKRLMPSADLVRVQDTEMAGAQDPDVLMWAAQQQRVLLTHDRKTIPKFAAELTKQGMVLGGVFIAADDAPVGRIIDDLILILECSQDKEYENQVRFLPF